MIHVWWFLKWITGTSMRNGSGVNQPYNFVSGFGSDLGEITLIGLALNWYRMHKCDLCWRLSKHDVKGTHYSTCHKHTTEADHAILWHRHKKKFPLQHKLMNKSRQTK